MGFRRGIAEKSVQVFNPLPDVPHERLVEMAKLTGFVDPMHRSPFEILFQWSGGDEREVITLLPGERHVMRESDAAAVMKEKAEQGLVLLPLKVSPTEERKLVLAALVRAQRFWNDRGAKGVIAYRKVQGLTAEEAEEQRADLHAYHINQAKADVLLEEIKRQRTPAAA